MLVFEQEHIEKKLGISFLKFYNTESQYFQECFKIYGYKIAIKKHISHYLGNAEIMDSLNKLLMF